MPDDCVPILSQLVTAELAERDVRSIRCPAGDACSAERGLSYEVARFPACKYLCGFDFATSEINAATLRQPHK